MIVRSCVCMFVAFAFPALAQEKADAGWIEAAATGCRIWNAQPAPLESVTWSGGCVDGKAEGPGVLQWYVAGAPDDRYEGEMHGGRLHGHLAVSYANGDRFEGEWRRDRPNGPGTFVRNGWRVSGSWTNGCLEQDGRRYRVNVSAKDCGFR